MYERDDLDILICTDPAVGQRRPEEYVTAPALLTIYGAFNVRCPPFDDLRVRQAFVMATDRERLADVVLRGYSSPATGGFVPPGMPGHSAGTGLPYEPARARQLLTEAGYPAGRGFPAVEWLARGSTAAELVRKNLQMQWHESLGVEIELEMIEWATLLDRLRKEPPHMFLMSWIADYPDPDNFLRVGLWRERAGWRNQAFIRLVERARRALDQGERIKLYSQADGILVEEAAIIPLTYGRLHMLVKPWVSQFPIPLTGGWFWKDVIIEPH